MAQHVEWNEYTPPRTELSAAIQYPIDDRWSNRIINTYLKDERKRLHAAKNPASGRDGE